MTEGIDQAAAAALEQTLALARDGKLAELILITRPQDQHWTVTRSVRDLHGAIAWLELTKALIIDAFRTTLHFHASDEDKKRLQ